MDLKNPKWITSTKDGVIVRFYIQPKASRSEIFGEHGEGDSKRLKVRISAPPVDGAANEELIHFLKNITKLPASRIHIIRGEASRSKDVLFREALVGEMISHLFRSHR